MAAIGFLRLFKVFEEIGVIRHLVLHLYKGCADKNQVLVLDRKITGTATSSWVAKSLQITI